MAARLLITGVCGFVGSAVARALLAGDSTLRIIGLDNLARPGSATNVATLKAMGVHVLHGDARLASDVDGVGPVDWVIDAAALPSVLAGVDGKSSGRQLMEHNLVGTINVLEHARQHDAGVVLLSTSRVYSVEALSRIPVKAAGDAFAFDAAGTAPIGCSAAGIAKSFSTAAPVSLYGATKLASEALALEYGHAFGLPVFVNRCGVLAGGGQFGTPDQGIFSYWVRAHARRRPLRYIGFDGTGRQVRDALHPDDLTDLIRRQITGPRRPPGIWHAGGGADNAVSLAQLTAWCDDRFGPHAVAADLRPRPYDAPWLVMDAADAAADFDWRPTWSIAAILEEIAVHHAAHPHWLEMSGAV